MARRLSLDSLEKRRNTETKKLEEIKAKIKAKRNQKSPPKSSPLKFDVREMADEYEDALKNYRGYRRQVFPNRIVEGSKSFQTLARAVQFAKELNVDYRTYVTGLFYIADKWWNKAPSLREISDYKTKIPAKERVSIYLQEIKQGEAKAGKKVVGAVKKIVVPESVKFRQSDIQMRSFMKNYGISEEEVFERFGQGKEAFLYFDKDWLLANETYLRLREEGRI